MTVRIGVDFGTAFTKMAILAGRDRVAVDFSPVLGDSAAAGRHVLPGFVHKLPDGEYGWRHDAIDVLGNLKLGLIDSVAAPGCPSAALAYLALAIRYARASLYANPDVGRGLASRSLRWELNIGCPTKPHEDPEVVELFKRMALVAWNLAAASRLDDLTISEAWRYGKAGRGLEAPPSVVPEFVAQIAGYLGSKQVGEGLHALVDIGAGTFDVAAFNVVLEKDAEMPHIPIFGSAVKMLGTHFLSRHRHAKLGLELTWDDAAPVPATAEFARRHHLPVSQVVEVEAAFSEELVRIVSSIVGGVRAMSGHHANPAWTKGLPVFITGGGAGVDLYVRATHDAQESIGRRLGPNSNFRFVEMEVSGARVPRLPAEQRGRLSVAIGLTEDAENIARVTPFNRIPPVTRGRTPPIDPPEV